MSVLGLYMTDSRTAVGVNQRESHMTQSWAHDFDININAFSILACTVCSLENDSKKNGNSFLLFAKYTTS